MAPQIASAKRNQLPRVIPAIPRALDKSIRDKKPVPPAPSSPSETLPLEKPEPTPEVPLLPSRQDLTDSLPSAIPESVNNGDAAPSAPVEVDAQANGDIADTQLPLELPTSSNLNSAVESPPTADPPLEVLPSEASQPAQATPPPRNSFLPKTNNFPPSFHSSAHKPNHSTALSSQSNHVQPPAEAPARHTARHARPNASNLTFGTNRESVTSSPGLAAPQPTLYQLNSQAYSAASSYPVAAVSYGHPHPHHTTNDAHSIAYPQIFSPGAHPSPYSREFNGNLNLNQPRFYPSPGARGSHNARRQYDHQYGSRFQPQPPQNVHHTMHASNRAVDQQEHTKPSATSPPDMASGRPGYNINHHALSPQQSHYQHVQHPNQPHYHHYQPSLQPQAAQASLPSESPIHGQDQLQPMSRLEISPLAQWLCNQFNNPLHADYSMQLSHSENWFPPNMLSTHGVILARSPKLRSLMAMQHSSAGNSRNEPKQLVVPISDRFLNLEQALTQALLRLYGIPLPDRDVALRLALPSISLEGNVEAIQMRFALAYAAAGHFLQMDEIISHGLNLAASHLSWVTVAKALAFGLEGGLSSSFSQQIELLGKDKGSASSVDDTSTKFDSPSSAPTYGFYSDRMVTHIVNFLVLNCPPNFAFFAGASQLNDPPRLPPDAEPKHSRSTSRLSQIRFGDMTMEDPSGPRDPVQESMSSILLSLPFPLLVSVLESNTLGERIGWNRVADVMREVIREREQRRERASKTLGANGSTPAVDDRIMRTLRCAEHVESSDRHPTGLKLTRQMAWTDTPPSSGVGAT